jgi:hypothetical protein
MHQNVVAFHAANGMLNKDTDLTQDFIGSLLLSAPLRVGMLFTLARLLGRDVNLISTVVRLNALVASIDPNMNIGKPV